MPCTIFVNDVGTFFKVTIKDCDTKLPIDLSVDTTLKQIIFKKPDKVVVPQVAEFFTDGSDGIITYLAQMGDLDMEGTWSIQGYVEGVGFKNSSTIDTFVVSKNLQV